MPSDFLAILQQNMHDLRLILPQLAVVATFLAALVFDLVSSPQGRKNTVYVCIAGLLVAMWLNVHPRESYFQIAGDETQALKILNPPHILLFSGMLAADHFSTFFNTLLLLGTLISLMVAGHARELEGRSQGEFCALMVGVCAGGMFLAAANNLLMIYLGIETLSVLSYALAGFLRRDRKSAEAGIKYVVYGAMASGLMLFGMSYLYGLAGTLNLAGDGSGAGLRYYLRYFNENNPGMAPGALRAVLALVFCGFLYKIAAVPFHYWAPDVYEGAPTTATAFFSVVPKAAGFAVLIRVIAVLFPFGLAERAGFGGVETVATVLAMLTMTVGNLAALGQTNAKRLLAYSSIAHAGYMLAGLAVLKDSQGPAFVLFYLVVYLFMNLGAFLIVIALENKLGGCDLKHLSGAMKRAPLLSVLLCVFLFSLVGVPPLAGFTAKYLIMLKLASREKYGLVFFMALNSVVSLYYYMKLAKAVAIDAPDPAVTVRPEPDAPTFHILGLVHAAALLALFFFFEGVGRMCLEVVRPLR